jgi:hypothetical protein
MTSRSGHGRLVDSRGQPDGPRRSATGREEQRYALAAPLPLRPASGRLEARALDAPNGRPAALVGGEASDRVETLPSRGMKLILGGSVRGRRYGRATGIGAFWENVVGQAVLDDRLRAWLDRWPPVRLARLRLERVSVVVVCPRVSRKCNDAEEDEVKVSGRAIGLDVHLEFCEVAIVEDGAVRSAGRIETTPERLELFARSLGRVKRRRKMSVDEHRKMSVDGPGVSASAAV